MRHALSSWWQGMTSSESMSLLLQLGAVSTPFPTLIIQSSADATRDYQSGIADAPTDHDLVVVRRIYTA